MRETQYNEHYSAPVVEGKTNDRKFSRWYIMGGHGEEGRLKGWRGMFVRGVNLGWTRTVVINSAGVGRNGKRLGGISSTPVSVSSPFQMGAGWRGSRLKMLMVWWVSRMRHGEGALCARFLEALSER